MEISIHNVLDGEAGSGDYTMLGVGGLELAASPEAIEVAMKAAGVRLKPYTAAAFGYSFEMAALNGKIVGDYRIDELNRFAGYLASLGDNEREQLSRYAAQSHRLTPTECMVDTPYFYDTREFAVALIPEEYHTVPSIAILRLPATDEEFIDAIDRARTDGCESYIEVRDLKRPYLKDSVSNYPNLYELNHLAQRLAVLSDADSLSLEALVRLEEKPPDVARLINLTYNLDSCVMTQAADFDELGHFALEGDFFEEYSVLPEEVLKTLDYEQLGRRFHKEQGGVFLDGLYIVKLMSDDEMQTPYNGDPPMPNLCPRHIMRLLLEAPQEEGRSIYLDLPASQYDMKMAAENLGRENLGGYFFVRCQCSIPRLDETLIGNESIYELSDLAEALSFIRFNGDMPKYKAALEMEQCASLREFMELAVNLNQYEFLPEIVSDYDYGEWELLGLYKLDRDSPGMEHFDFAAFGRERMEQNGARITPYGLIIRADNGQTLSPEPEDSHRMGGMSL